MGSDRIASVGIEGGVAHVELARADKFNAMDKDMFAAIGDTFRALGRDPAVRAILLSGQGKHFTAGLDLEYAASQFSPAADAGRAVEAKLRHIEWLQDAFSAVEQARAPVIAAVHGGCIGAGVDLATACDLRVATADAFFQIAEVDVAITADLGTLQRLGYLIPQGVLRELTYTGRRMAAEEAARLRPRQPDRGGPRGRDRRRARHRRGPSPPSRRSRWPAPRRTSTTAAAARSRRACATSPCGMPGRWPAGYRRSGARPARQDRAQLRPARRLGPGGRLVVLRLRARASLHQ